MVYESDFYTTRRPYSSSSSRPYVSSYNVTPLRGPFYLFDPYITSVYLRTVPPHMPYIAHRRLVSIVHSPARIYHAGTYLPIKIHSRVRPSIIAAELNRIRYLTRPSSKSYVENYLNSKDYIDFDDEAKEIRAKTDNLLRRVHVFVPRPVMSDYDETSPEKLRSDDYVKRIINAKNQRKDIEDLPWYSTPAKRDIGSGHLACIKYAGGRPQAKRRSYYTVSDLVPGDVKSDVKLMSYYSKNRKAAEDASAPVTYFTVPLKESRYEAPAPTVRWAADIVEEKEIAVEPITEQDEADGAAARAEPAEVESSPSKPEEEKVQKHKECEDLEAEYDENGVKKQPDADTIKKVQAYLDQKAAEKKMEEERRAWEAAERKRIAEEKEIARLAELKLEMDKRRAEVQEQERLEAERQAVIAAAEAARQEAERLVEDEKMFNEAVAQALADEQERMAKEMEEEQEKKKQEEDEDKNVVTSPNADADAVDGVAEHEHCSEEHSLHADVSDQDYEAKPYEVDHEEDTQVEEDEHEEQDEIENPFDGPGSSAPVADEPVEDEPKVRVSGGTGGEQGFDWSEFENEPEAEKVCEEVHEAKQEEDENPAAGDHHVFEESEVESHAEEDVQIEEVQTEEEKVDAVEEEEEVKVEEDVEQSIHEEEEVRHVEEVEEEEKVEEEEHKVEEEEDEQRIEVEEEHKVEEVEEHKEEEEDRISKGASSEEEEEEEEE